MNMQSETWFKFFACCFIVDGFAKSLIYDVQRNGFYDLPTKFAEVLKLSKSYNLQDMVTVCNTDPVEMESFLEQFIKEEIAFYTSQPDFFPDIDLSWHSPFLLTNAVIEVNKKTFDIDDVFLQLNDIGCQAIQIRFLGNPDYGELVRLMGLLKNSRIKYIELILPYQASLIVKDYYELLINEPRLNRIVIYRYPEDSILFEEKKLGKAILGIKKDIEVNKKEVIKPERFKTSIESFTEAQSHNIGLNRKLCISGDGEIKNFLNHAVTFGNINKTKIVDVLETSAFKEKWYISNDQVEVCKDCQYRYCCVSNSDLIQVNDLYFKTEKCSFDPYTDTWKLSIEQ